MPEPVALGIKVPDSMATLGGIMGIARGAQELQKGRIDIESHQKVLDETNALRGLMQNGGKEFMDAQGNMDWNKFMPSVMQAAPTLGPKYASDVYRSVQEHTAAKNSLLTLDVNQLSATANFLGGMVGKSPQDIFPALDSFQKIVPATAPGFDLLRRQLQAAKTPEQAAEIIRRGQLSVNNLAGQKDALTSGGIPVTNQQQTSVVQTNPIAGQAGQGVPIGQPIPGTAQQQQLPPTTPVFNPVSNTPGYLGPQAAQGKLTGSAPNEAAAIAAVQDASRRGQPATIQSGPALGVSASVEGTAASVNKDWDAATEAAKTATTDIANLENIKRFSKGAVTGVEADRRSYLSGLAGLLGMKEGELAKTSTDLLAKNANMLALAGGDTNLAKTMAESANPNTHMTKEAIQEAANQIIAQRRLALAKQEFMRPYKALNDPDVYNKALIEFNKNADPRALQWLHMSPEEKKNLKASLSPEEHDALREKIKRLTELGILK